MSWLIVVLWFNSMGYVDRVEQRQYYSWQRECEEGAKYIETHMSSTEIFRVVCVPLPVK